MFGRRLSLTPMLSVMVCPSLKPKSRLGPESPSWELLRSSFSCLTHLQGVGHTHTHTQTHKHTNTISNDTDRNNASQPFLAQRQHVALKLLTLQISY